MTSDQIRRHVKQLKRIRDMKAERLASYRGTNDSFLRADVGALNFAIRVVEGAERHDILKELASS